MRRGDFLKCMTCLIFKFLKLVIQTDKINTLKQIINHEYSVVNRVYSPPEKDCARTSAVKAVFGLTVVVFSSNRCSPSTFLQRPYRKLWRMSEVMMSDRAKVCCLNPAFRTKASAGNTEPMAIQNSYPYENIPLLLKLDKMSEPSAISTLSSLLSVERMFSFPRSRWALYASGLTHGN